MKASEIIQAALDNHYCNMYDPTKPKNGYDENKSEFMCHALTDYMMTLPVKDCPSHLEITQSFMVLFESRETGTLASYLRKTDKKYASYKERYGHGSMACHKMRLEWWNAHIAELKEQGL
jgi:hypothetical protein